MSKVIKFGDNIDTDQIVASQHLSLPSIDAIKQYTFEHHANFTENFKSGDFVVAEENFGCGSSREQAPAVLKALGVEAVIAKSFARIFFRNAINLGILVIECPEADRIDNLDEISIDLDKGKIVNKTKNEEYSIVPMTGFLKEVLDAGGIVPYKKARLEK
ncbi:3-isopropylmalate dehydratase, small subunit [Dethiosulfatibacter aminovorans DSM 17477]|uniref:3-isopropylmalate dehydratase, small subunit n=1 Tax=Dethiosulfatibacter aminovorans DSM 17477 TaxID=1121476 RepID=A0A1M6ATY5_9FIRM|nr:3-isopropylmalate dehydratase small subunit [Dethiosulfatibacter aminovorans]SHI39887.1 3-isopropylmalate dehydratase, small subunit [Dethiosulfatibacter aminovorans DSM 17477]